MRFPVWIDGDISVRELTAIFNQAGYHLHSDGAGRMVVDHVPAIVRKNPVNVVPLARARKAAR